jgi:iron complex outermembrane recepter protein
MMMRLFSLIICLFTLSVSISAQNETVPGSIKGIILAPDRKPVAAATVRLKDTKKMTLTNNTGAFSIENIEPGNYLLEISSIGYQSLEQDVTVIAGGTAELSVQLPEAGTELTEVIVSAGRNRETIDEVPSSVSIVGLKTLQQNINITSNLGDILENRVSGLAPSTGSAVISARPCGAAAC